MYMILDPEGVHRTIEGEPTLKAIQQYCDGDVEVLAHDELPFVLWMNENKTDNLGNRLPMNTRASTLMTNALWPGDHINGMVVLTGRADDEGEVIPLDDEQVEAIIDRLHSSR